MDQLIEVLRLADQFITKTDQINRRLITAITIITITLCSTIMFIVGVYFLSDYQYPEVNQEVKTDTQQVQQNIK